MRYLGGKARIGKKIAEQILLRVPPEHRVEYLEPFLGGANAFEHIAPHFQKTYAGDVHEDLILMWQAVAKGWLPPEHVSEEEYQALKKAAPSALRGFAGFGCSFGGMWFQSHVKIDPGHYEPGVSARAVLRPKTALSKAVTLVNVSYLDWPVVSGVVVYCDPPYEGTAGYKGTLPFDHARFWARMREWSEAGSYVFVSEESAPDDVAEIWTKDRKAFLHVTPGKERSTRTEKLFYLPPRGL